MKKILTVAITFVMVAMISVVANATTSSELADVLYSKASKYGMTSADKVKIERYLSDNPVSDEVAGEIVKKADAAVGIMEASGKTSYSELDPDEKASLQTLVKDAGTLAGVTVKIGTGTVEVWKGDKLIEKAEMGENGKLKYTGNNSAVVVASSLAIIALVAIVAKKRLSVEG